MLKKENRLVAERDFKRVYQKGSFFSLGQFSVNFIPNKMSVSRLGFVVSKKVAAKATIRNKIKRKFREAARLLYADLPRGYDVVVTIKNVTENIDYAKIKNDVQAAFKRIK